MKSAELVTVLINKATSYRADALDRMARAKGHAPPADIVASLDGVLCDFINYVAVTCSVDRAIRPADLASAAGYVDRFTGQFSR